MNDIKLAMLGSKEAAKRLTEVGVLLPCPMCGKVGVLHSIDGCQTIYAAVAYIEGGPYDNDLPGMEFALKIDRLSRDFVRPPEGEA